MWSPTGMALAAVLRLGSWVWPGIFLGALLANFTTNGTLATSAGIAIGNTLEAVAGAWLMRRVARGEHAFNDPWRIVTFVVFVALTSTTLSATVGVTSLYLGGFAAQNLGLMWLTWWLGDVVSALTITPLVVIWSSKPWPRITGKRFCELVALVAVLIAVGEMIFGSWLPMAAQPYPRTIFVVPVLLWAAFRFGQHGAVTSAFLLFIIALHGTLRGLGPFAALPPNDSLLMLQVFVGTATVTALIVAAVVSERRRANEVLRHMEHRFRVLIEKSSDAIGLLDARGIFLYVSPSTESLLGYRQQELMGAGIVDYIHPEDRLRALSALSQLLRYPERIVTVELRVRHQNGSWHWLGSRGRNLLHDPHVQALVVNARDITERQRYQAQLQASLREKEILLKEIHHRVKNNLQVVSSLLNLQAETFHDSRIREAFHESQSRIKSMALVHESLYDASDLAHVDVEAYLRRLTDYLWRSYSGRTQAIALSLTIDPIALTMDTAIPCGLMINELVSNAILHGFPQGQAGRIHVHLRQEAAGQVTLAVSDTGVGLPADFCLEQIDTLGLRLVDALAEQLGGTLTLDHRVGTTLTVTFTDSRLRPEPPVPMVEPAPRTASLSNGSGAGQG